jgi:isopenicillin N synthase-like dioxygenase
MNNESSSFKVNPDGSPACEIENRIEDIEPARTARCGEIPVIDISCLFTNNVSEMRSTADQIRSACERIGFFYIVNHGVPQKVVDNAFEASRRFFDQSESFKQQLLFDANDRGYKGPGNIAIPGYPSDLKEVLDFGVDLPVDHPDVVSGKTVPWAKSMALSSRFPGSPDGLLSGSKQGRP